MLLVLFPRQLLTENKAQQLTPPNMRVAEVQWSGEPYALASGTAAVHSLYVSKPLTAAVSQAKTYALQLRNG